ncbi:MAG TPA: AsmA-like C-terminal region-containing protein, partial [Bacteroidales bacterium]|nr:AsmA-like C-terminal region-containing protein [Bacteroidales bacterium]
QVRNTHLVLQDDRLEIINTQIKAGHSDLLLNGYLTDIRRVLLGHGSLGLNFDLQSDTLDCNELIRVVNAGISFADSLDSKEKSILQEKILHVESEKQLEKIISSGIDQQKTYEKLLIVPGNVNLQVVLAVSNAYYRSLQMKGLHGMLRAADRYLQLDQLQASSNAGDICINGLYATPDKNNLHVGLDIEMQNVLLEQVIRLLPPMDTLFPMISSFKGLADVQISATSQLDTNMNLVLSSFKGACRIKGDGLVLLDGKTFSEISRKLMFRKKALNLIDNIRVEAAVADNRIDVFPFIMEIDRYRTAIAGSHKMDGTFHYHISLLKSPVPFRFGLNVYGTPDDYKIDLGRSRFTDQHIPVLSYRIDSIRVNLKETISNYFKNFTFE